MLFSDAERHAFSHHSTLYHPHPAALFRVRGWLAGCRAQYTVQCRRSVTVHAAVP